MSLPSRTEAGARNLDLLFPGKFLVLVEGPEDIRFWAQIFPTDSGRLKRHVKAVGGKEELRKYIAQFPNDSGRSVAAIDSDFDEILGTAHVHPRVIATRYYSIENVIICRCRLSSFLAGLCASEDNLDEEVSEWLNHFDDSINDLFAAEICAIRSQGSSFHSGIDPNQLMEVSGSGTFDTNSIAAQVSKAGIAKENLQTIRDELAPRRPRYYYRGHFLLAYVSVRARMCARSAKGRSVSVSNDALFAAISGLDRVCGDCQVLLDALRCRALEAVSLLTSALFS